MHSQLRGDGLSVLAGLAGEVAILLGKTCCGSWFLGMSRPLQGRFVYPARIANRYPTERSVRKSSGSVGLRSNFSRRNFR